MRPILGQLLWKTSFSNFKSGLIIAIGSLWLLELVASGPVGAETMQHRNLKRRSVIIDEDDSHDYNKFEKPNNGHPAEIAVFIHFESLRDITSEVTLDFYLVQFWNDSRLKDHPIKRDKLKITGRQLPDELWYPDTYFLLVRDLLYSAEEQYIIIEEKESLEFNRKVRLKTPCTPNVLLFPFDVVRCQMMLSSFGYDDSEVVFHWLDIPGGGIYIDEKNNNVDHLGFFLMGTISRTFAMNYGDKNFSTLETVIFLERKFSAYLIQVYFPAALIVILSWTIFWINLEATPARASLGVTTVLTMLTLATQSTSQNAKHVNNKVTAIDIYLWACFVFVIFAMIEFALSDFTTHSSASTAPPSENARKGSQVDANGKSRDKLERVKGPLRPKSRNFSSDASADTDTVINIFSFEHNGELYERADFESNNNGFSQRRPNPNPVFSNHDHVSHKQSLDKGQFCLSDPCSGQSDIISNKYPLNANLHRSTGANLSHRWQNSSLRNSLRSSQKKSLLKPAERERLRLRSLHMVNNIARILFPLSFLIFNVCYWAYLFQKVATNDHYKQQENFVELGTQS